jgi:hypothetical protein
MKYTSLIVAILIVFAATGSAAAVFSKPHQSTADTFQKFEVMTPRALTMQRPI